MPQQFLHCPNVVPTLQQMRREAVAQYGASQEKVAKTVGRQKLWVNALLKGIPKKRILE